MQFTRLIPACALFALVGCQPESKQASSQPAKKEAPNAVEKVAEPKPPTGKNGIEPKVNSVTSTSPPEFEITYEWNVEKKFEHDWRVFVHFTDAEGQIKFQNDHDAEPPTTQWEIGKVQQGPFTVKAPEGLEGEVQIRMGLYDDPKAAEGSNGRLELDGNDDGERRIIVGRLLIGDANIELLPID